MNKEIRNLFYFIRLKITDDAIKYMSDKMSMGLKNIISLTLDLGW